MSKLLIVQTPDGRVRTHPLSRGRLVIGSAPDCGLVIEHDGVAPHHLEVVVDGREAPVLNEFASDGGTFVNERRVSGERSLSPGDIVQFSGCEILVQEERVEAGPRTREIGTGSSEAEEDLFFQTKVGLHQALIQRIDLRRMEDAVLRSETERVVRELIREMDEEIPAFIDRAVLLKQMIEDALGLGPLEDLMADPEISEIMVNRRDQIYVERFGRLERTDKKFLSEEQIVNVIQRIVAPLGRSINESRPMVDARLPDGSRVNAIIPPLAVTGPTLTIRKFSKIIFDMSDLVEMGTLSAPMARFLETCVVYKQNLIISGGSGAGKTTLLNMLGAWVPEDERLVTVEDAAELSLPQEHVVSLEVRPANIEGRGEVTFRDLVINALRMRPDRIIVGECRGGEAIDMLQAMNTGHEGSLTSIHSNSPRDALARLETMVLMSGLDLPSRAIRENIASSVDVIIQTQRFTDGSRKVTHISEVTGIEGNAILVQDIFRFRQSGRDPDQQVLGEFVSSGSRPRVVDTLREQGFDISWDEG